LHDPHNSGVARINSQFLGANYQKRFEPFVLRKQKAALRFAGTFAPKSKFSMFLRNQIMNLLTIPWIADVAAGRNLADDLALPDY